MRTPIFPDGSLITGGLREAGAAQPFRSDSGSNAEAISCVRMRMLFYNLTRLLIISSGDLLLQSL